jgi:hypothetical protein
VQSGLSYAQAINSVGPRTAAAAREAPPAAAAGQAGGSGAAAAAEEEGAPRGDLGGAGTGVPSEPKLLFTLGGLALAPSATIFQAVQVGGLSRQASHAGSVLKHI